MNCDGQIDSLDALIVLKLAAGQSVSRGGCGVPTDVNCDGVTNSLDALAILRFTAGLPDTAQTGCAAVGSALSLPAS